MHGLLLLALAGSALPAWSDVLISGQGCPNDPINQTAAGGSLQDFRDCGLSSGFGNYGAKAGAGAVGAFASAHAIGFGFATLATFNSSALGQYRDAIVITGPSGAQSVAARLRLHADGDFDFGFAGGGSGYSGAIAAHVELGANSFDDELLIDTARPLTRGSSNAAILGSSFFASPGSVSLGQVNFISPDLLLPVGVPVVIALRLSVTAGAGGSGFFNPSGVLTPGQGDMTVDVFNTLSFPLNGFVFDLPEGYTANSSDGAIVDNRWAFAPTPPGNGVPEPGSLALLMAGLTGLAWRRPRRIAPAERAQPVGGAAEPRGNSSSSHLRNSSSAGSPRCLGELSR